MKGFLQFRAVIALVIVGSCNFLHGQFELDYPGVSYQLTDIKDVHSDDCDSFFVETWRENSRSPFQITYFAGVEGSKQPQDFGVNANFGARGSVNLSGPLAPQYNLGFQLGTAFVASANAVQVFELLSISDERTQSFTTAGLFQRLDRGFSWGIVYDFLSQDSSENFTLGQWRIRLAQRIGSSYEIGTTVNLMDRSDDGFIGSNAVTVEPIDLFSIYVRKNWASGAVTSIWVGQSSGHSEDNLAFGTQPRKENTVLFGSEIFAPLNHWMAIYGEANIITPVDTGAVDAYLGVQFATDRIRAMRKSRFSSLLPVAASTSFTADLRNR